MRQAYQNLFTTDSVRSAREKAYGPRPERRYSIAESGELSDEEIDFIESRDSFYMATVSEDGWPYVQHRGGNAGFLKAIDSTHLAFADFGGNRQLFSAGNIDANRKVSLFLMDYAAGHRLKIAGLANVLSVGQNPAIDDALAIDKLKRVEGIFTIEVLGFDWNCPQHIPAKYSKDDVDAALSGYKQRIADLETKLANLKENELANPQGE